METSVRCNLQGRLFLYRPLQRLSSPLRSDSGPQTAFPFCTVGEAPWPRWLDLGLELLPKIPCLSDSPSVYEFIVKVGIVSDEAIPQDFFGNLETMFLNKLFPSRGVSIPNNEPFD